MRVYGYLFLGEGDSQKILEQELEAAHQAGLANVEMMSRAELDGFDTGPCIGFPHQAQFHPIKYLLGLAAAIVRYQGQIYTGVHVDQVEARKENGYASIRIITGQGHTITAQAAVIATNRPLNETVAAQLKQSAYRTYVIGAQVPSGALRPALYWDTLQPYHYIRIQPGEGGFVDMLLIGGEDHAAGQAGDLEERWQRLEQWGRARFPMMGRVEHRWSGQILETVDGLACIGPTPTLEPNVYIATGDSGMGMTHGSIAGILLRSLINQEQNPWVELYSPLRFKLGAAGALAHQDMNTLR
jgi:glycine/D-amino acid oxidase-like deaminating enzyme